MDTPGLIINGRYQIKGKPIGHGGMGVVYKAYDSITKRDVALKTMRGTLNPAALELFSKEWTVLARMSHPNIIDILDTGEFEQDGERKPFFVMPLLPGGTLENLIVNSSTRLTVERVVGITAQTCRGLQAAHEKGLIHRDLKPSNIFVMDDDTVKIIDFGVVHLAGAESIKGAKGTLQYMAPEQVELKPMSPASDIFSLGVVCYQALTGRKPFARKTEAETVDAILRYIPPPVCELNPLVSQIVSRVIHKAMAKDPWHRFSTAREYAETLQKALNGQSIERFDRAKIQPRIDRAKKAQMEGDLQFAIEILTELEAEGNIDPEMTLLRIQINQEVRQKSIRQLLDSARTRLEEDEFPLALQKIQEVLRIDPDNPDAIGLKTQIEKQRSERQTENWFRLVEQHLHNKSFDQAKQALEEILKLNANDNRAREMLVEVRRREQEISRLRGEKEQLYQSAVNCYQQGEVSSALSKLERVLDLHRQSPDSAIPERDAQYQSLYNQIRTEREAARNAYAEGRRYLADRNFAKALETCAEFLKKSPGDPMFQALKLEAEEQQRQEQSSYIAEVARRVEAESDLDRRVNILKEAAERYPEEAHFQQSLRLVRERRDLVNSIVGKARQYEERAQFNEALSQFDILRNIYAQYPGIEFETERLKRRRDEQFRDEAKGRWVDQIDRHIASGDYARARELARTAMAEFPNDRELAGLERLARQGLDRAAEAEEWLRRAQSLCADRQINEGLEALRKAASLDDRSPIIRGALLNALVEQARAVLAQDWRAAEPLIQQALSIDPSHPLAKSLQGSVLDYKRQEIVNECITQAREMQVAGELGPALAKVEEILVLYPNEARLVQLRATLRNLGAKSAAPQVEAAAQSVAASTPAKVEEPRATVRDPMAETIPHGATVADYTLPKRPAQPAVPPGIQPPEIPATAPPRADAWQGHRARATNLAGVAGKELGRLRSLLQSWAGPSGHFSKLQWVIIGAAAVILLLALGVTIQKRRKPPLPPVATDFLVQVESNVGTAKYLVDGKPAATFPIRLPSGEHKVEASALGYVAESKSFTLSPDAPKPFMVTFQLAPELMRLRLSSGLKTGRVSMDDQPAVDLQDGGFANEAVTLSADHKFSLQSGPASLTFSFRAEPGGIITLSSPVTKDLHAVLVTNLGPRTRVHATDSSLKGGLQNQTPQPIPSEGVELTELTGNAEFIVDDGKNPRPLPLEVSNAPTLAIWLNSDPNQGTIHVQASVPDADATIDGRKPQPLRQGRRSFYLEPGPHVIRVVKEGYEAAEQKVELKKGDILRLPVFDLKPIVRTATLMMEGATRDAEVWIDGVRVGAVTAEGFFKREGLSPEGHTITLKKENFEDKPLTKTFIAGQTVVISGLEGQLTPFGVIQFRVTPPGANVSYRRVEEAQVHVTENGKPVQVRAGRYAITASASGYRPRQETIAVETGRPLNIDWALPAVIEEPKKGPPPTPPPPTTTLTKDYFQEPGSWTEDGQWWLRKGAGTSWLNSRQGSYEIEVRRMTSGFGPLKRTKPVEWIIDQRGLANQIEYRFDFGDLERQATVNGKTGPKVKKPEPAGSRESYVIRIEIAQEQIVIRDAQGRELDRYPRPNPAEPLGRFGFKGDAALIIRRGPAR